MTRSLEALLHDPLPQGRVLGAVLGALALALLLAASPARAACLDLDHSHQSFSDLLSRHVQGGRVDYDALLADRSSLDAYTASLEAVCADDFNRFSGKQRVAFWINSYNAYTLQLILDNYPLESIRDIGLLPYAAFRKEFIPLQVLGDDPLSLEDIEHGQLRANFHEPRVHFALVCASESCPPLRSEAYRADALSPQLNDQAHSFLNDPTKNRLDVAAGTLYLSRIFEWFSEDFLAADPSLAAYVVRYLPEDHMALLNSDSLKIEFLDYDWSLNKR